MEALTLDRSVYNEAIKMINENIEEKSYTSMFSIKFPEGINTAATLEICRAIQKPTLETKVHLMRLCIAGKNVEVTCPNGDVEKFCMTNVDDNLEAFPLFKKDPMALIAISDSVFGYILKKSLRLSRPKEADAVQAE